MDHTKTQKILFVDIDDTLVNSRKEITPENAAAIREALRAGHKVVISTGRPLAGTKDTIRRLGLTSDGCYAITFNGGLIWDSFRNRAIFRQTLPLPDVRALFQAADQAGIHCQTYDDTHVLCERDDPEVRFYCSKIRVPFRADPDLPGSLTEEPVKVLMIDLEDHDRIDAFRESIEPGFSGRVSMFFSNQYFLECVKDGLNKGFAVRFLADYLGIPMDNTVAAGDSANDIEMLKAAHIGCAMANATPECKAAAGYITERDCENSGVAEIIRKFIL